MITKKSSGFTLLELIVTITVIAILLSVGVPSMRDAAEKRRTISAAEEIYGQLQLARSEAIARSQTVFFNIAANADWAVGVSSDLNCDPSDNDPACTLPDVTNNNPITHRITAADHDDISLGTTDNSIAFLPQRGIADSAIVSVTSTGDIGYAMNVIIGPLGQISMCSSNVDVRKFVRGYRACN